ncbi:MAG: DegT/DnrJ/EryC1/StrS family aminotransferase, partial [Leptospiraceae bacterium]|nr:DegT/DnrJ/EryC1/StrS family aminotransferase [Leptospiraceae bacterium]
CFGVTYQNESIYKKSFVSTTSFYPAKVLGAAGDGGAVFTNDPDIADRVRKLSNHGRTLHYEHGYVGWNSRLDSLQAAYLNLSLKRFPERLKSRQARAKEYQTELKKLGVNVIVPPSDYVENGYCNVNLFPNQKRTELETKLKESGIGFANIYPRAMSDQAGAKGYLKGKFGGENARNISESVLNLPLFPYMKDAEFQEVLDVVRKFLNG